MQPIVTLETDYTVITNSYNICSLKHVQIKAKRSLSIGV